MPIGYYHIEVDGTEEYLPASKTINLVNEEDKDEIVIFVGIKPRIDTNSHFLFSDAKNTR